MCLFRFLFLFPVLLSSTEGLGRCPTLNATIVCFPADRAGLAYSDGCNQITCLGNGRMMSTAMFCPLLTESSPFCERLQAELHVHQMLKPRNECPSWRKVCRINPNARFKLGCDRCACKGTNNARCSTTSDCLPPLRFLKDDAYAAECRRRLKKATTERNSTT